MFPRWKREKNLKRVISVALYRAEMLFPLNPEVSCSGTSHPATF
jgi:hypothetical protein